MAAALYNSVLSDDFSNVESLTARLKAIKVSELEEQLHKKKQKPDIDDFDLQEINAIEAELSKLSKKNESEILEIDISPYLSKGALDNIRGRIKTISEQLNAHSIPETYKYYLDVAQNIFTFYKPNTIEEQELMRSIKGKPLYEYSGRASLLASDKESLPQFFDLLLLWYRDVLLYKSCRDESRLCYQDESFTIRQQANDLSYQRLNAIFDAIDEAKMKIGFNVRPDVTLTELFSVCSI